jgi:cytochrome c-type biogenesis protein CcmH/NrfG
MANVFDESHAAANSWPPTQVYLMAGACLVLGLAVGYLFRGSELAPVAINRASTGQAGAPAPAPQMPTLEQMKHMADKKAEPLLAGLKTNPGDPDLLMQLGTTYKSAHQFKEAADYYEKSLQIKPGNVAARTELASCLYYTGDVDGAIRQLEQSLKDDPRNANSLFNLGMIKWKSKQDKDGALAAWRQLLKSNPDLPNRKKAEVKRAIARVQNSTAKEQ